MDPQHNPLDDIAPVNPVAIPQPATLPAADNSTGPLPEDQYDPKKLSLYETYDRTAEEDFIAQSIYRTYVRNGFAPDGTDMPALDSPEFKQLTDGIPEEQWPKLYAANSVKQREWIAQNIREEMATEQLLAERGAFGVPGRFVIDMMDPTAFAVGAATGGIGVASKAARLAKTAARLEKAGQVADASAALEKATAVAKATSALKIAGQRGAIDAGVNMALAAVNTQGTPIRDQWDVVHAGLMGFGLGAGLSGVFSRGELTAIRRGIEDTRAKVSMAELSDYIDQRKKDIVAAAENSPTAVNLKNAQDDLDALQTEIQRKAEARQADLTSRAAAGPNDAGIAKAAKAVKRAQKARDAAENSLSDIQARLLKEDTEIHGDAATSPALTKLREKVAKRDHAAAVQSAQDVLDRATEEHSRLLDAQTARGQLNDLLKSYRTAPDDHLGRLAHPDQADYAKRLEAAHAAVADAQKAHDAAMAAHEADLAKLTQIQEAGVAGLKDMDSAEAADAASAFGEDSGGAARFMGVYESVNPEHEYPSGLPMSKQAMSRFGRVIGTIGSILRGNDNEVVRAELGPLVGDSIGTVDGSTSSFGASEIAKRLSKSYTTKFNQAVTDAYKGWVEARGMSIHGLKAWTRPVRDQFMSDVGLHIRGQLSQDKDVARAAESIRALFKSWDDDAREAGVPGFEEGHDNPNFLPRVFDFNALERIERQIGTPNVKLLFQKAIQKAIPEIEEKIAARMAQHYVLRMKQLRVGDDIGMLTGMQFSDIGFLRKFLEEAGAGRAEIDEIADKFAAIKKAQHKDKGGDFRNAKHRMQMDENFGMDFRQAADRDGSMPTVHVKISDLLENNVEALYSRYQRSMAGHIGLAKVGIKSHAEFMQRLRRSRAALEHDPAEAKRVTQLADLVYKLITGQPVEDANFATKFGRLIRDWNYTTTMNQAGFSQTPDWAGLLSKGYLGYTLKFLPEVARVVKRARNGELMDEEANMLQDWLGIGTDNYNNSVFSAYDDPLAQDGFAGAMGKVEHGLRVAGRITTKISGLGFMNDIATRMAAKAVLHRLVDEVRKGGAISSKRLAQIGLDQKMLERIRTQVNGTTEHVDADFVGKARILNFAKWTDIEARDAMLNGIFREARRLIQEEDLSETNPWIHKTLGKVILQFRRFMLVSYTKQMLYAANMRDAEAATQVLVGTALAALSYSVQFGIKAASIRDPDEREKFKAKYLTPKAIALAAWSRGNYSAFLPAAMDTITGPLLGIRNFDNRASQLGSGLLDGNPSLTGLNSLGVAAGSLLQPLVRGDKQFTQSDAAAWRHLLPFQNFIGMDIPFNALTKNLPKKSKDPNPNHTDWVWQ